MSDTQQAIQERRESVYRYLLRGLTQSEIAAALNVSQPSVCSDIHFIQSEAVKTLPDVVEKALPWQFEKCMRIVSETMREAWTIYHSSKNDNIRLKALREIRESAGMEYELLRGGRGLLQAKQIHEEVKKQNDEIARWKEEHLHGSPYYYSR